MADRVWTGDVRMQYPKKWIIMTNLTWEPENKLVGEIYSIKDSLNEAMEILDRLGSEYGRSDAIEGFDPSPQIGNICG